MFQEGVFTSGNFVLNSVLGTPTPRGCPMESGSRGQASRQEMAAAVWTDDWGTGEKEVLEGGGRGGENSPP